MKMLSPNRLSLNMATVKEQWNFRECVKGCLRHGFCGIGPWRDKLHKVGIGEGVRMIKDSGLTVTGLVRGGWYTAEGALTDSVLDDNRYAVDEAVAIGAECVMMMVVGGLP